jgi:Transglutaminase-like superfamily
VKTLVRARRLDRRQWRLLGSATLMVACASVILRWRSFENAIRFGCVPLRVSVSRIEVKDVVWAVRAAGRWVPFRAMCIEQGLAAQRLLRRAGIDARLHYGARSPVDGAELSAHVWVSVDGVIVIGGEEAAKFAEVAAFP